MKCCGIPRIYLDKEKWRCYPENEIGGRNRAIYER